MLEGRLELPTVLTTANKTYLCSFSEKNSSVFESAKFVKNGCDLSFLLFTVGKVLINDQCVRCPSLFF